VPTTHDDPRPEYVQRLAARRAWAARRQRQHIQVGNARLVLFLIAAWIAWAAFVRVSVAGWWLAVLAAAFIALVVFH